MRAEVSSSLTSAHVSIEANGESKVSGELDLLRVHCDGQTINWTERRCDTLSIHLEGIKYDFTVYFFTATNASIRHESNY